MKTNVVKNTVGTNGGKKKRNASNQRLRELKDVIFRLRSRRNRLARYIQRLKQVKKPVPSRLRSLRSKISWQIRKAKLQLTEV